jgi:uncharacterized protein (TIGR02001 family)
MAPSDSEPAMGAAMTVKKSTATGRLCLGSAGLALLLGIALGPALAVEMPDACNYKPGPEAKPFDVKVGAEFNSDYIYRGVTLSAHQPAMGFSVEVDRGPFYFTFEPHTVNLPTAPSAELGFSGGWCREVLDKLKLNLGVVYFYYANEVPVGPVTSTSYGEAQASIAFEPTEKVTFSALYGYAPNYSNSGAWEHYVEGGLEIHMEKIFPKLLPDPIEWSIVGSVGHSWFGTQSAALGGFPLPSYTNWSLGISFERDPFTLSFTYSNTSLTKENCFVFTGDLGAVPGGVIDPITNPMGLRSNWCGPAFVGTLSWEFSPVK